MKQLKALALCVLSGMSTQLLADIRPETGPWGYSAHRCTNNTSLAFRAGECGTLTVGTWTGSNQGPYCANETYPMPWPDESMIESRVSAHANASAAFQGWLAPGHSTTCTGFYGTVSSPLSTHQLGVEANNFGPLTVDGVAGVYGASKSRTVRCPDGSSWDSASQTCARDPVADPYKSFNSCPANGTNPVNAFNAEKVHVETDFVGVGPHPLTLTRYYSTRTDWRNAAWDKSGFGIYWRHTYSRRAQYSLQGTTGFVTVYRENGNRYYFKKDAAAVVWSAVDADVTDKLEAVTESAQQYWVYTNADGVREKYADATGRLIELKSPEGYVTRLTYNSAGRLDTVSNGLGQALQFTYYGAGVGNTLISSVSVLANGVAIAGSDYRFEYKDAGLGTIVIGKVYYPDETPSSSNDNPFKEYMYNEGALLYADYLANIDTGPAAVKGYVPRLMTGIKDENGSRYATYKYQLELFSGGDRYWVPRWGGHGAPDTNGKYADEFKIVDYSGTLPTSNGLSSPGSVQIQDAKGVLRTFNFARYKFVDRPTTISTPVDAPCQVCGTTAQQNTYDPNTGFVTSKLDFAQNKTLFKHASNGLQVCRLEGVSTTDSTKNAPRRVVIEWDTTFRVPTEVRVYEAQGTTDLSVCDEANNSGWDLRKKVTSVYQSGSARLATRTVRSYDDGVEDEAARSTSYAYYQAGDSGGMPNQLKAVDGPRTDVSDVTTFQYAKVASVKHRPGDLVAITNALGQITTIEQHDAYGRATRILDPSGSITTLSYHPRGWLRSRSIDGNQTTFSYDNAGQLGRVMGASGSYLDYDYDTAHRLTDVSDNFGNRIHYTLDPLGNRVGEDITDPSGTLRKSLRRLYKNENNRLEKLIDIIDGSGTTGGVTTGYRYDNNGNLTTVIDPRDPNISATGPLPALPSNATTTIYDALDRAIKMVQPSIGAIAHQTFTSYDVNDHITGVRDPANTLTVYINNGFGELRALQSPDTGTTLYQYDAAGNLTARNDARPSAATTFQYDALNRLTKIDYPSSGQTDVVLVYDENRQGQNGVGRLTSVSDESGTTHYRYDQRGNLLWVTASFDGLAANTYYLGFRYDATDSVVRILYPSGRVANFVRDPVGRIVSIDTMHLGVSATLLSNANYAPFGPLIGFHYGAGASSTPVFSRVLDLSYRVTGLSYSNGVVGQQYSYLDGGRQTDNITAITDQLGANSQVFAYDILNRLSSAVSTGTYGSQNFADLPYDALGNRKRSNITGRGVQSYTYSPGTSRLEAVVPGGPTYRYDEMGNAISRQGLTYVYGDDARPEQVSSSGTPLASYAHSYRGQRTKKVVGTTTSYYLYGLDGDLLAEVGSGGTVGTEYVYLEGMPVTLTTPEGARATDADGDLLPDVWEITHGFAPDDPNDAAQDADNDGATNLAEYQNGSDAFNPDTDGDQLPDGWEIVHGLLATNGVDANQDLPDMDGLTNLREFQLGTDPQNSDTDHDTLPDGQDPGPLGPSWLAPVTRRLLD